MTPLLEAEVEVPGRLALTRIVANPGERIAIIGPNGSGKTSLLRALAGIEQAAPRQKPGPSPHGIEPYTRLGPGVRRGTVIDGAELGAATPPQRRRLLAFLPASRDVPWPIPVADLVALGLEQPDPARVATLLDRLDLQPFANRPVDRLSTGERARALLARALAASPKLLLLDEPLSNLDPAWALRILDLVEEEAARGTAVLLSLHDLGLVHRFTRVLVMDKGQLQFDGTPAKLRDSELFGEIFGLEPAGAGWKLRPSADRRSSP